MNGKFQLLACLVKISADSILEIFFLFFPENKLWSFHANCFQKWQFAWKQFAWNVRAYFLGKIRKMSSMNYLHRFFEKKKEKKKNNIKTKKTGMTCIKIVEIRVWHYTWIIYTDFSEQNHVHLHTFYCQKIWLDVSFDWQKRLDIHNMNEGNPKFWPCVRYTVYTFGFLTF